MSYKIRISADDAGLHPDIDAGIMACAQAGNLTAISVISSSSHISWSHIRHIVDLGVGAGIHFTFVDEPWLTTGKIFNRNQLFFKALTSPTFLIALKKESRAQVEAMQHAGIPISHADSHQHVHAFPAIGKVVAAVAEEYGIGYVRCPRVATPRLRRKGLQGLILQQLASSKQQSMSGYPICGLRHAGGNTLSIIKEELKTIQQEVEVVLHPGNSTPALQALYGHWQYNWSGERDRRVHPDCNRALRELGFELEKYA
ncbi:hypothetical protein BH09BAC1_BH09BAC1_25380 [soil metagenome]